MRRLPLLVLLLAACAGPRLRPASRVASGLDVLERSDFALLKGKRVGVITNPTGVDSRGKSIVDLLAAAPGVTLAGIFSPEHGYKASSEANEISSDTVRLNGRSIPLYSLYAGGLAGMRPKPDQLKNIDVLVFDIQDVGARFYTYFTTMAMALEAAKDAGVEFMVLDRPNPIGGDIVEGPLPDEPGLLKTTSVAYLPLATRHGLTVGEAALLHNAEVGHPRLTIVKLRGWKRSMWYDDTGLPWVAPSPNMPNLASAALYPGTANFEDTNVSVGRGTPTPFDWIGAPWMTDADDIAKTLNSAGLPGIRFSPKTYTPSKSIYAGKSCPGLLMTVTDREAARPLDVFARAAAVLRDRHPKDFQLNWKDSRKLIGSDSFKATFDSGADGRSIAVKLAEGAAKFRDQRAPYLLYGDVPSAAPHPSELSVEELAGQVFMIALDTDIAAARQADIRAGRLGGALLRWDKFTGPEARAFALKMRTWTDASPHGVPLWLAADHEGGPTFTQRRYGATAFPGNMALGASGSAADARAAAKAAAEELRALGVTIDFAPDIDVNSNPSNPIIGLRSFGEDPAAVTKLGIAAMNGYEDGGVLPVVKHFPGHGDTSDDSHLGLPVSTKTLEQLEAVELVPFRAAIKAGAPAVMPAHMVFAALGTPQDTPVTLSSAALTGFLRGTLGFDGLIFSDSLDMGAIANVHGSSEAAISALLAGADVLLLGKADFPSAFAALVDAAKSGRVPRARLEAAAGRILAEKERLGAFAAAVSPAPDAAELTLHRALAQKISMDAVTLVRNDGTLPLKLRPDQPLGLVMVRAPRYPDEAASFAAAVRARHPQAEVVDIAAMYPSTGAVERALNRVSTSAAVILATYQFGQPLAPNEIALARTLAARPAPLISVSLMNPYDLTYTTGARAAVSVYGMTPPALEAAAALIFGEIPAKGKLPVTVPGVAK